MTAPFDRLALVVPTRGRADEDAIAALVSALRSHGVEGVRVDAGASRASVDDAVRHALADGVRLVVACGDDRLVSAMLPAVVEGSGSSAPGDAVLGLFPGGATCDFAHTFGLDLKPPVAASVLASPRVIDVDVGVATCAGDGGGEVRRLVANAAVVGLGAVVQRRLDGGRGGRALSAWWSTLASYRRRHTDVDMVFAEWHDPCTQVWLANGQYGWGGLLVAPSALPEDGAWDVQVWGGARSLPFTLQPKMIRGEHLPHDDVATWRQKRVTVTSEPPSLVAADGAVVGTTPATFEIRSRALRLKT